MQGNPLLTQTKQKIDESIPPKYKAQRDQILKGARAMLWSEGTHGNLVNAMKAIQSPEDIPAVVAKLIKEGAADFVVSAKVPMKLEEQFFAASMNVGMMSMCDVLQYVESQMGIPITKEIVAATTKAVHSALFQLYGITEEKAKQAFQAAQQKQAQGRNGGQPAAPPPAPMAPAPQPQGVA